MPFDQREEKIRESELRRNWRDLSDIAREDIMDTLKNETHIGVNSWTQTFYEGNQIGCLMMDGHTDKYQPWKNKVNEENEVREYDEDLQDEEESSFLEEIYKCDSNTIDAMAGAFDRWAAAGSYNPESEVETTPRLKTLKWTVVQKDYSGPGKDYKYEQTATVLAKAARKKLIRILESADLDYS